MINAFCIFSPSFVSFNQVRIPRENLLNRTADVTPVGKYVTPYKDPNKRFGAALGALSGGRVGITSMAVVNLRACMPIAIRYMKWTSHFSRPTTMSCSQLEPLWEVWVTVHSDQPAPRVLGWGGSTPYNGPIHGGSTQ